MADAKLGVTVALKDEASSGVAKFGESLSAVEAHTSGLHAALERIGESIADVARHAVAFAAGNLMAQAAMNLEQRFMGAIEGAEHLGSSVVKLQRLVGGSAEEVSGLVAVFGRWGIGADDATKRLTFLARGLAGLEDTSLAVGGKTVRSTLEGLGVDLEDAQGKSKSTVQLFGDIAEAMKNLSPTERTGALTGLFGRGASDMAPIFANGREGFQEVIDLATKYGLILTGSNVQAVKDFSHAHHEMDMALQGVGIQLGTLLMPALTGMANLASLVAGALNTALLPAINAIPSALGAAVGLILEYKIAAIGVAGALMVQLAPALATAATGFALMAVRAIVAAGATLSAWAAAAGPIILVIAGIATAGVVLQKIWETNFLGIQQVVAGALNFVVDKLSVFLDWIADLASKVGVHLDWRAAWGKLQGDTGAALGAVGESAQSGIDQIGKLLHGGGMDAGKGLGEGLGEGLEQATPLDKAMAAGKRLEELIAHRTTVLGRENLDVKVQEAGVQAGLMPMKERQSEIELQLLELSDKRTAALRESAIIQAQMASSAASNALADANFEEQRIKAKMKVDALSGKGVSSEDITALTNLAKSKPQLELDALMAARPATLLERQQKEMADKQALAGAPLKVEQAGNEIDIALREREIGRLNAQIQAAQLANAPELADLEAKRRTLEDANFAATQQKADKGGGMTFSITQHITSTGEVDYDKVVQMTYQAVFGALSNATSGASKPNAQMLPGSRGAVLTP